MSTWHHGNMLAVHRSVVLDLGAVDDYCNGNIFYAH